MPHAGVMRPYVPFLVHYQGVVFYEIANMNPFEIQHVMKNIIHGFASLSSLTQQGRWDA